MSTKVYGASDDLVEIEGDVYGESGCYGCDKGVLVVASDGTVLTATYGKADLGIWDITAIRQGKLFDGIVTCDDADADPNSDVAHFRDGLKWAFTATEWEKVR